ncbi:MAG TPA: ATP-binding protein [Candidatus Binataceae bacterium]|nr:ATP-binding protein [Candidatus Binataceae bacterium]
MASSPKLGSFAAVIAGLLPAAVMLAVLSAWGAASPGVALGAIVLGLGAGYLAASKAGRAMANHAERLDAIAAALEARTAPPHLLQGGNDAMGRAELRLLDATDAVVDEIDSLAEQRDEFEAILRSMTEAVVVVGRRGEVVLLNGAARRMFALEADTEYRGRDFVELCRDPRLQEFVARATRPDSAEFGSAEFLIQNPALRHLSASAAPIRSSQGAARVFVFHDITQLKAYETVRQDFIANLTHELRTPLSALYGYAETLMQGVEDKATQDRFLGIIDRQAHRLARLLDDLISLSDLERGASPLKLEPLDARVVISEAVELMRESARREGVSLEVECPADLPRVAGDRDRLHQVMVNLLDNAIKFTPRDGRVTVSAAPASLGGNDGVRAIALAVADTGEGIPERDVPRLTERFYRVDRARSRELGGTGLGLAIVKHIVQLHRGALKIESKLGVGTTVTLTIPEAHVEAGG